MMLEVSNLQAAYGASQVLFGVDLHVAAGEMVTLLGRNGMGKTTSIKTIMGMLPPLAGRVFLDGDELTRRPSFKVAQAGIGLVPEGRQIFPNLSVRENLVATAANRNRSVTPWGEMQVLEMFPELSTRLTSAGADLSGGEQQMLSIARALMTNPKLLVLDEATEGLAPLVRKKIWACLRSLREQGLSLLVVDKNIADLLALADRHYIIEKGRIVWEGSSEALSKEKDVQQRYLGV